MKTLTLISVFWLGRAAEANISEASAIARLRTIWSKFIPNDRLRELIAALRDEWSGRGGRISAFDTEFVALARTGETTRRLTSISGMGALNAMALLAAAGNAKGFDHARDFGGRLALAPRAVFDRFESMRDFPPV